MNIDELIPQPTHREPFTRKECKFVPESPGCYVLTTFNGIVLYIGLATNLRRRMNDHLDNPAKTCETVLGRAIFFHWLETPETNKVERTWMNTHIQHEGVLPILNSIFSPVGA
jgi:excinuclease UvrABC nuclease subunit